MKIWDIKTNKCIYTLEEHQGSLQLYFFNIFITVLEGINGLLMVDNY